MREVREERGWTQQQLARAVKTTQTAISRLEHRRVVQRLDVRLLEKIARALGVPLRRLIRID